jgi:Fic family protein
MSLSIQESPRDEGEHPSLMEPMLPSATGAHRRQLEDLAVNLVERASRLAGQLRPEVRAEIGILVRSMNCYYSNLIEGHDTHPIDIDRALRADYSHDPHQRSLQLEARAHIEVQAMLDGVTPDVPPALRESPVSARFIQGVHAEFCSRLPDELLWVAHADRSERARVASGELRRQHVKVGRHVPVSPGALSRFLDRFTVAYDAESLSRVERIIAVPAAHHRLLWIHPFVDGNGRVTRLMSHAMLRDEGIGTPLWSVSRGLARNDAEYKRLLTAADEVRRGDTDGRGALSEAALAEFCEFFLRVCLDQIDFMEGILEVGRLLTRIEVWTREQAAAGSMHSKAFVLIREAFDRGVLERGRAASLTGLGERQARKILAQLIDRGVFASSGHRDPVRLVFTSEHAQRWLPNLYPL